LNKNLFPQRKSKIEEIVESFALRHDLGEGIKPLDAIHVAVFGRRNIRRLLEAFEPHHEAMLLYLDQRIKDADPEPLRQQRKRLTSLSNKQEQAFPFLQEFNEKLELLKEQDNVFQMQIELSKKIDAQQTKQYRLEVKREKLLILLGTMRAMREEGTWEKIGENEKDPIGLVVIGEPYLYFRFTKHQISLAVTDDIYKEAAQKAPVFPSRG
jgi:hypothetical protein